MTTGMPGRPFAEKTSDTAVEDIRQIYSVRREAIRKRLAEFERLWIQGNDAEIFAELVFCLLTPQSKAKLCWDAVTRLLTKNLLLRGSADLIVRELNGVRFHNNKAKYIIAARNLCGKIGNKLEQFNDVFQMREWFVANIKGFGYKEASHFLRNIGFGENIAILDRHILKNLLHLDVVKQIPKSLSKQKYYRIEEKMRQFAKKIHIPMSHLDLVFWCKETGEIFK